MPLRSVAERLVRTYSGSGLAVVAAGVRETAVDSRLSKLSEVGDHTRGFLDGRLRRVRELRAMALADVWRELVGIVVARR